MKVTLVGFNDKFTNKYIPSRSDATYIDLQYGSIIDHTNDTPETHGDFISMISTEQFHMFFVAVHNVSKYHGGR